MQALERDYYPLPLAAAILDCIVDDLIHWAANGKIRLGVLFHVDESIPKNYVWIGPGEDGEEQEPIEFHGFAYVDKFYFAHCERRGELCFNRVEMPDGDTVILPHEIIVLSSMDSIYMHQTDIVSLMARTDSDDSDETGDPASAGKPLKTTERNTLLTIIAALCNYSDIKHQERGAAAQLARLTQDIGAAVTDDTIRSALKQIPKALETRMK